MQTQRVLRGLSLHAGFQVSEVAARLEGLYRRFGAALFRRAARLLKDEEEAHDVVQETFLGYLKLPALRQSEAQPFTVLYQIATYQALDRLRRRARWSAVVGPALADGDEETVPEVASPIDDTRRVDAAQDLALLTRGEDEQTMTAATLYYVEGLTTEEVAQMLDVSRKTVGRLLAQFSKRARKRAERMAPGVFS